MAFLGSFRYRCCLLFTAREFENDSRRANAYQAYYEHMPLSTSFSGRNGSLHHGQVAGYDVERQRMGFFHERDIPNPIVLSGDIHTNFVNKLKVDFDDPDSAMEFVGTSMSSRQRDAKLSFTDGMMAENPFFKFHHAERGYVRCEVTPDEWRSDYQVVESVTRKGAPLVKRASFVVADSEPGVKSA